MELDLKQNRAHLVIFTALGVTLLNLEIKPRTFNLPENSGVLEPGRKFFAQAAAGAVQHIFLNLKNSYNQNSEQKPLSIKLNGSPAEITGLSPVQTHPEWEVTYHDYREYDCGRLPQRIILQSHKPAYKLTIWLHEVRELKK
jgi:hypothetical protein